MLAEQLVDLFVGGVIDRQAAGLEDDALIAVVVDGHFRIGGVARIDVLGILAFGLIAQPAAVGDHAVGLAVEAQSPAGDVGLVRALVAGVAVAIEPLPVPIVMKLRPGQLRRGVRGRAAPQIEIRLRRDRVIAQGANRLAALVAQTRGRS